MVFHRDPAGVATIIGVYLLLIFGDFAAVNYVIEYGKHESLSKTFQALLAHFLLVMAVFSHLRAMLSDPGFVPLSTSKIDFSSDLEKGDPNQKKKSKKEAPAINEWTVCTKCEVYRPPRSHHCRTCRRCVRRMDHHCPWINNCVGELNFKYFFLFLVYTGLLCVYGIILIVVDWTVHYNEVEGQSPIDKIVTVALLFEAIIFGLFVTAMAAAQLIAVLCDRNAIEIHRYGRPTSFPKMPYMLLLQGMCGRGSKLLWPIPCVRPKITDPSASMKPMQNV